MHQQQASAHVSVGFYAGLDKFFPALPAVRVDCASSSCCRCITVIITGLRPNCLLETWMQLNVDNFLEDLEYVSATGVFHREGFPQQEQRTDG